MSQLQPNGITDIESVDPHWRDLYKIGGITSIINVATTQRYLNQEIDLEATISDFVPI